MDEFTIGVEEEYQLVSARSGELQSRARDVLAMDWSGDLRPENQQTMLEIGTHVCGSTDELREEIRRLRAQVATAAASEELRSVAAGIHPFSAWEAQRRTTGPRYRRLLERYGRVLRSEHIFGMHVHVAVPERVDRTVVLNRVRAFNPHLLALSASSPIYEGADTGYASYRTVIAERLPHSGPPPRFRDERDLHRFVELLVRTGAIEDDHSLYWSTRPHPEYPTVEFRMTDACPRAEDAVAIAALARTLVAAAVEGRLEPETGELSEAAADELLLHNGWRAARYGLDAMLVDPTRDDGGEPVRDSIRRLLDRLAPVTEGLGDSRAVADLEPLMDRGNAASRIRALRSEGKTLPAIVDWLARETLLGTGLDRRADQRQEDGNAGSGRRPNVMR